MARRGCRAARGGVRMTTDILTPKRSPARPASRPTSTRSCASCRPPSRPRHGPAPHGHRALRHPGLSHPPAGGVAPDQRGADRPGSVRACRRPGARRSTCPGWSRSPRAPRPAWSSSTAASSPRLSPLGELPAGVIAGEPRRGAGRRTPDKVEPWLGQHAALRRSSVRGAQHRVPARRRARLGAPRRDRGEADPPDVRLDSARARPSRSRPSRATCSWPARTARSRWSRPTPATGAYFTCPVTELVAGPASVVDHYKFRVESREAFHMATFQIEAERSCAPQLALDLDRRRAGAQRRQRRPRRRGHRLHPQRPLSRRGPAGDRQPHARRARQAALRQPRAVQGRPRRRAPARCSTA